MFLTQQWAHGEGEADAGDANRYYTVPHTVVHDDVDVPQAQPDDGAVDTDGFDMVYSMHTSFTETLKTAADDSGTVEERRADPRTHPLFVSLMARAAAQQQQVPACATRQHLQLVPRAHEEALMRPARDGEVTCRRGAACEAHMIAQYVYKQPELGFTCVAFTLPDDDERCLDLCVLCLRKETAIRFYSLRTQQEDTKRPTCVIQPYRNKVASVGEYRVDACLYPSRKRFEGISDPYVQHLRHRYKYEGSATERRLRHCDSVLYFRPAPPVETP